ncbi:ketopantoate reductase family protein [Paenibacillus lentus]|uniref:2-dehydropantoate 2-reductase n=1 Tax=Paenibacillus lentus TaxID=1338368 RepID=A0A3S8RV46_9BACL|nr:2-dehydropantoate 2-reductase [Paenibacillus lentus]AZK46871.1 2-dehydropantoate 2-reductase [Paenibacillus lentus]
MKFDVVGAGALGLMFGCKLAASGQGVRFWTRTNEQAKLLVKEGIMLLEGEGSSPMNITSLTAYSLQEASTRLETQMHADWIILATKQRHIDNALVKAMKPIIGHDTKILCLQNGIGHVEFLSQAFPKTPLYAVITTEGAKRSGSYQVIRAGKGVTTVGHVGSSSIWKEIDLQNAAEKLIDTFDAAGFCSLLSKDIDREIYRKLLINSVINPLTAMWRITNGELLESEERRKLLQQLCEEAIAIYEARNIPFEGDAYDIVSEVCRSTAINMSSMLKDVLQGVPTEIDYINGRLVEMAKQSGMSVPGHEMIWRLVRGLYK